MKKIEQKEKVDKEYLDMMLYNFNYAIKTGHNLVYMGYRYIDDNYMKEYWIQQKDWIKTLDILIKESAELEEFEFAIEFKKIKDKI